MSGLLSFINWSTPLQFLAVYGLVRYFAKPAEDNKAKIQWTALESVSVTLAIYFFAQIVAAIVLYAIPASFGVTLNRISDYYNNSVAGQFILILAIESLTVLLLIKFLHRRNATLKTIGLHKSKWTDIGYVLIGFGLYFIAYLALLNLVKVVVPTLDLKQAQDTGFSSASSAQLPLVFISLVILPPLVEEILIRGFLYSGLRKKIPLVWAVIITSGLFAIAHLQAGNGKPLLWTAAIDTFVLSLILIYLREKTGSLWASIGLHMLKNGIAFLSLFVFRVV